MEHAIEDFNKSYSLNPNNRDYQAKVEELGLLEKALQVVRTASSPDKMAPATERAPAEPSEALTTAPPERALPPATKDTGTETSETPTAESSDGASPPSTEQTDTQLSRLPTHDPSKDATTRAGMGTLTEGDGNLVFPIQSRLKEKGLDPGPLDGLMGPRTRAAIKAYQGKHGLIADGKPTRSLLDHLEQKLLGQSSKDVGG